MTNRPVLSGARVRLTAIEDADLPVITRWHQDTAFLRLFDAGPAGPRTRAQIAEHIREDQKAPNAFVFAIRRRAAPDTAPGPVPDPNAAAPDELIGLIDLTGILWSQGVAWLSIGIGPDTQRGQGLGEEALRLLLDFAFSELNLRRVQLTVFSYNARAIRLYERVGFVREGVYREFGVRDGQPFDMLLYGLLRREWREPATPTG